MKKNILSLSLIAGICLSFSACGPSQYYGVQSSFSNIDLANPIRENIKLYVKADNEIFGVNVMDSLNENLTKSNITMVDSFSKADVALIIKKTNETSVQNTGGAEILKTYIDFTIYEKPGSKVHVKTENFYYEKSSLNTQAQGILYYKYPQFSTGQKSVSKKTSYEYDSDYIKHQAVLEISRYYTQWNKTKNKEIDKKAVKVLSDTIDSLFKY